MREPGEILGDRYRLIAKLGEGGMGAVFRAENIVTGKQVAIKWMHPHLGGGEASERLLREARAASSFRHPNVVDVYDVLPDGETLFLVMELLNGESLRDYLTRNPQPKISDIIALLLPALAGVAAAHEHGVIHRDLKPDNIFLQSLGGAAGVCAKVLDFGVAKLTGAAGRTLTMTGVALGTPLYMPLEQLRGDREIDARADVYAFGVMLYEAITGRMPFEASTLPELAFKVAMTDAAPVQSLRPDVPTELARIIDWAVTREREHRLPDVQTLARELEVFAGADEASRERPPAERATAVAETQQARELLLSRAPRRRVPPLWISALLVLLVAAAWMTRAPQPTAAVEQRASSSEVTVVQPAPAATSVESAVPGPEVLASRSMNSAEAGAVREQLRPLAASSGAKTVQPPAEKAPGDRAKRIEPAAASVAMPSPPESSGTTDARAEQRVDANAGARVARLTRACEGNDANACYTLASLHRNGLGVPKDPARALALYKQACSGGNSNACMAASTISLEPDPPRATKEDPARVARLQRACASGDVGECYSLASLYRNGLGVPVDLKQAAALYKQACDLGSAKACSSLQVVEQHLSTRDARK